jgi:hypothetical protein
MPVRPAAVDDVLAEASALADESVASEPARAVGAEDVVRSSPTGTPSNGASVK